MADNSGAKVILVIGVLRLNCPALHRRTAGVGDMVVACHSRFRIQQCPGDIVRAVIVRNKYPTRRKDGFYVRFDSNACVILKEGILQEPASSVPSPVSCVNAIT